jgi:hypothetical protein
MIWFIAKKEFRNSIVTAGFVVGLLLCLALIPYTVYTGIRTYENRLAQYETDVKAAEEVYGKSQVYSQVNPLVVKPVSPLSIFSRCISEQTGSKVKLDRKEKPVFSSDVVSLNENPFMGGFMPLDFATALTVLLSLPGVLSPCRGRHDASPDAVHSVRDGRSVEKKPTNPSFRRNVTFLTECRMVTDICHFYRALHS